jgi:copper chaperone CopZ
MMMGLTVSRAGRVTGGALGILLAMDVLLVPVTAARAEVEAVTVRLEDERCSACTARIASNLRRLEGVRSAESSVVAGTVSLLWRPGVPLEVARIKEAVLRWRGGVRYGGADVTLVGTVERAESRGAAESHPAAPVPAAGLASVMLRSTGTHQPFCLKAGTTPLIPPALLPGQTYRVTGRVIKTGEGKHDEIWLQLERAEPVQNEK